jgi:hypothetical protein
MFGAGQYQTEDALRYSHGSKSLGIRTADYARRKHADSEGPASIWKEG